MQEPLRCRPCGKSFTGDACMQQHLQSAKHIKTMMQYKCTQFCDSAACDSTDDSFCMDHSGSMQKHGSCTQKQPAKLSSQQPVSSISSNQMHSTTYQMTLRSEFYCDVCCVSCSGKVPFEAHISSEKHRKKAYMKQRYESDASFCSDIASEKAHEPVPAHSVNKSSLPVVSPSAVSNENASFSCTGSDGSIPMGVNHVSVESCKRPFACELCNITCTGQEPYDLHMNSEKHKKKMLEKGTVVNSGMLFMCEQCQVPCYGPLSYEAHLNGTKHKKMEWRLKYSASTGSSVGSTGSVYPYKCDACNKNFTGIEPYMQHIDSFEHEKNVKKKHVSENCLSSYSSSTEDGSSSSVSEDMDCNSAPCAVLQNGCNSIGSASDTTDCESKLMIRDIMYTGDSAITRITAYHLNESNIKVFRPDEKVTFLDKQNFPVTV